MPDVRLPLSGDVIQAINPWQWMWNATGGQYGLVNINLGQSADPALERQILDEVGSYGRQIGRLADVLAILLKHVPLEQLSPEEREQVQDFQQQQAQVQRLKRKRLRA